MKRANFLQLMACSPLATVPLSMQASQTSDQHPAKDHDPSEAHPRILLEAHRGNSVHAPENTLIAIEQALAIGVDRVEIDLMVSADGYPVVIHDLTVDRTTDGTGTVAGMNLSRLRALDAGSWKASSFRGEKIPTLAEVFDLCRNRAMVNIDLKSLDAVEPLVKMTREWKFEEHLVITGMVPASVPLFRSAGMHLTQFWEQGEAFGRYLKEGKYSEAIRVAVLSARENFLPGFLFHSRWVDPSIVHAAHLHGMAVNVYAVNDVETLRRMIRAKVDGVMTDDPLLIKKSINMS